MKKDPKKREQRIQGKNTECVHGGKFVDDITGGVTTPIFRSTSYLFPNDSGKALYPRYFNIPTQSAAAEKIRALEGGEKGLVLSSGMAAISTVLFAFLRQGDHAVFQRDLYGGTYHFVASELQRFGIETSFVTGTAIGGFREKIKANTRVLYFETPSNPLLNIIDLTEIAKLGRDYGLVTVIDNTFATPINQNPLEHGIDVVVHSGTKYLNGHSDVNCGAVVTSEELMAKIIPYAVNHGGTLDVQACYLLERGLKTLGLRMARHNENAFTLASFLSGHPLVSRVYYPGLSTHPGHDVAAGQMGGFGGMLSFELDCDKAAARGIVKKLQFITPAVSLGGVESLICFPAETSHAKMPPEEREKAGISDTLLRLSAGIEDADDLLEDLSEALSI